MTVGDPRPPIDALHQPYSSSSSLLDTTVSGTADCTGVLIEIRLRPSGEPNIYRKIWPPAAWSAALAGA